MDALSLLLSMANVTANSDVLVVDLVGGLLTGAVAERLGGMEHVLFPKAFHPWSFFVVVSSSLREQCWTHCLVRE